MVKFDRIADAIVEETYACERANGEKFQSRIVIGRPQRTPGNPEGDWCCPVFIEGFTNQIVPAAGPGPIEALEYALRLVKSLRDSCTAIQPLR